MTSSIIFATNNQNKVIEIRAALGDKIKIVSLKEAGLDVDIPEPYDSLEENAREKSTSIFALTGQNCFSEDTGLEVMALNNEPGVKSARYKQNGEHFLNNTEKLLFKLEHIENREAQFRTVISLVLNGDEHSFEGICKGRITHTEIGEQGFGYDPVFIPDGSHKTFAEMTIDEKNIYSHRKKATAKLVSFLNKYDEQN